jgi:hypothetical protein
MSSMMTDDEYKQIMEPYLAERREASKKAIDKAVGQAVEFAENVPISPEGLGVKLLKKLGANIGKQAFEPIMEAFNRPRTKRQGKINKILQDAEDALDNQKHQWDINKHLGDPQYLANYELAKSTAARNANKLNRAKGLNENDITPEVFSGTSALPKTRLEDNTFLSSHYIPSDKFVRASSTPRLPMYKILSQKIKNDLSNIGYHLPKGSKYYDGVGIPPDAAWIKTQAVYDSTGGKAPSTLLHIAPESAITSIKKVGLTSRKGGAKKNQFASAEEDFDKVYLFDPNSKGIDPEFYRKNLGAKGKVQGVGGVELEVVPPAATYPDMWDAGSWQTKSKIPPENIRAVMKNTGDHRFTQPLEYYPDTGSRLDRDMTSEFPPRILKTYHDYINKEIIPHESKWYKQSPNAKSHVLKNYYKDAPTEAKEVGEILDQMDRGWGPIKARKAAIEKVKDAEEALASKKRMYPAGDHTQEIAKVRRAQDELTELRQSKWGKPIPRDPTVDLNPKEERRIPLMAESKRIVNDPSLTTSEKVVALRRLAGKDPQDSAPFTLKPRESRKIPESQIPMKRDKVLDMVAAAIPPKKDAVPNTIYGILWEMKDAIGRNNPGGIENARAALRYKGLSSDKEIEYLIKKLSDKYK